MHSEWIKIFFGITNNTENDENTKMHRTDSKFEFKRRKLLRKNFNSAETNILVRKKFLKSAASANFSVRYLRATHAHLRCTCGGGTYLWYNKQGEVPA